MKKTKKSPKIGISSIKDYVHKIGYDNEFQFSPESIDAVKDSLYLFSNDSSSIYGKTGTESVNGQSTSGWFIGFLKKDGHTCFFATNIQDEDNADGTAAAELTFSILSELNLMIII